MTEIAIIVNAKAKNAETLSSYLTEFKNAGIDYQLHETEPGQLAETIEQCVEKYPMLLIGGGDGTIRTGAHYCAKRSTILGVLPLGTLNHFANELGLPLTPVDLVAAVQEKTTTCIDLAVVNNNIFVNNSSIGFYPKFAKKRDLYTKKYNKWLSYLPSFIDTLRRHDSFAVLVKNKTLNISIRTSFLMISNNLYTYDFPATIRRESFKKGTLGLYYFKHGKLKLLKIIRMFFNRKNNFEIKESILPIEIHIDKLDKITVSLDGDTISLNTPLIYKILPKSLNILTNKS